MSNAFDVLKSRGFLYQSTNEEALRGLLGSEKVTCYIGFDPTAESLHVGSLVPLMALRHMKRAGHTVILLCGAGTAMVGDPSGKQKMRPMMGLEEIESNSRDILAQLVKVVDTDVDGPPATTLDNADWLRGLNYIEFLRDHGRHMSVNRMLARESAKRRYESDEGLSFLEFNYMCLQAYDFLHLYREHSCVLQMGGQDQWGNICEGIDLIARPELAGGRAHGMTFPLLLSSSGEKFGKTAEGAVWLDAGRTPAFDYYQFWRNCDDNDVVKHLLFFTDLDEEAIRAVATRNPNRSKEILAYECTRLVHGPQSAAEAFRTAVEQYRAADPDGKITMGSDIPLVGGGETAVPTEVLPRSAEPVRVVDLLVRIGMCKSKGEARRLVQQGGVYLDSKRVDDVHMEVPEINRLEGRSLLVAVGKKRRRMVRFEDA
ncbi:MAG: tyrosine--tRNA ligase [Deltaproteobacteria bacterium]|nr:tyrosine--tRNA ligase [Deltaproteobacteria bacterium]